MAKVAKKPDVSTIGRCLQVLSIQRGTILTWCAGLRILNHDTYVQIWLHRAHMIKPITVSDDHEYFDLRLVGKCALVKRAAARITETELVQ